MEKFLQIVEPTAKPDEVEMDSEKSKFFNSKLKVWDFAKILSSEFQNLSFDDKSNLLKKYYVEILAKYSESNGKLFFLFLSGYFLAVF